MQKLPRLAKIAGVKGFRANPLCIPQGKGLKKRQTREDKIFILARQKILKKSFNYGFLNEGLFLTTEQS
jgi:hypothetical protein